MTGLGAVFLLITDNITKPLNCKFSVYGVLYLPTSQIRILLVGVSSAAIVFGIFISYQQSGATVEMARTMSVNALIMIEAIYLLNCRLLTQPLWSAAFFRGLKPSLLAIAGVIIIQLGFTYIPVMQGLFGVTALNGLDWAAITGSALLILGIVETEKTIVRKLVC